MSEEPAATPPAPRVRVTGPPRRPAGGVRPPASREIDAGTEIGAVYMRSLLREQRRLAVRVLVTLALTIGLLPLLFHLAPGLGGVRWLGMPLPWLLLAGFVYPWLVLLGWRYVRRAEANERDFEELVGEVEP